MRRLALLAVLVGSIVASSAANAQQVDRYEVGARLYVREFVPRAEVTIDYAAFNEKTSTATFLVRRASNNDIPLFSVTLVPDQLLRIAVGRVCENDVACVTTILKLKIIFFENTKVYLEESTETVPSRMY